MIKFFDKKSQDFLTVFTPFSICLIDEFKEMEESWAKEFLDHIGDRKLLPVYLKFMYNYNIITGNSIQLFSIKYNLDPKDKEVINFLNLVKKYGTINNVGELLYYQNDPEVEEKILKSVNVTINYNPLEKLQETSPEIAQSVILKMHEEKALTEFQLLLDNVTEEFCRFHEKLHDKEFLISLDKIFYNLEKIYLNNFTDSLSENELLSVYSIMHFGFDPFMVDKKKTDGINLDKVTFKIHKTIAQIIKHPMLYYFYLQEICETVGLENKFFRQNKNYPLNG